METLIRKSKAKFFGDAIFSYGISRSGYFNLRESQELEEYGNTFSGLLNGTLSPENNEEAQFINDIQSASESDLYTVKLWRKYLDALNKSKIHHGFAKSNASTNVSEEQSFE